MHRHDKDALKLLHRQLRLKGLPLTFATPDAENERHPQRGVKTASIHKIIFDYVELQLPKSVSGDHEELPLRSK